MAEYGFQYSVEIEMSNLLATGSGRLPGAHDHFDDRFFSPTARAILPATRPNFAAAIFSGVRFAGRGPRLVFSGVVPSTALAKVLASKSGAITFAAGERLARALAGFAARFFVRVDFILVAVFVVVVFFTLSRACTLRASRDRVMTARLSCWRNGNAA
jgi:hypothetical protein